MNEYADPYEKRIYVAVNGILTWPGSSEGWTDRFVTQVHVHAALTRNLWYAEKLENLTLVFSKSATQQLRVDTLIALLLDYQQVLLGGYPGGYPTAKLHLVGHSNGADVILRACQQVEWLDMVDVTLKLIAPAVDADCEINGINELARDNLEILLYVSPIDRALWLANLTRPIMRLFGEPYGDLGRAGPRNLTNKNVHVLTRRCKHTDWVKDERLSSYI